MMKALSTIRVYYAETDALGIVYHANYLNYMERARTDSLRELGFSLPKLFQTEGIQFTVSHIDIKYLGSATLDDELVISTRLIKVGRASLNYEQAIWRTIVPDRLLCTAKIRLACVDKQLKPTALPQALKEELINVS